MGSLLLKDIVEEKRELECQVENFNYTRWNSTVATPRIIEKMLIVPILSTNFLKLGTKNI